MTKSEAEFVIAAYLKLAKLHGSPFVTHALKNAALSADSLGRQLSDPEKIKVEQVEALAKRLLSDFEGEEELMSSPAFIVVLCSMLKTSIEGYIVTVMREVEK